MIQPARTQPRKRVIVGWRQLDRLRSLIRARQHPRKFPAKRSP